MTGPICIFQQNMEAGGAERVMLNLGLTFHARGIPVEFVVCSRRGYFLDLVPDDIPVIDLADVTPIRALPPFLRYCRSRRPRAVISALSQPNVVACWAARRTRIPTFPTVHSQLSREAQSGGIKLRLMPHLVRSAFRHATHVVGVSDGVTRDVTRLANLAPDRVSTIYNPVIGPEFLVRRAAAPTHPWLHHRTGPVIVGLGRLAEPKNFDLLIRAMPHIDPAARLVIYGEGELRAPLEQRIEALGLRDRVSLPGFVANPVAELAAADLFVLSSIWEGLPTALIEALAAGVPCVSTDCESGPREILRDGAYGQLVPVGDEAALAAAIQRQLD
ncbi:MAG: glycosyltransferase, partial [Fimbriimonadaceae bacterium]|nr:glycosyltransferase [Fimbriimonadaceae bacterium]